ncbi:glmZ(sRNA)-inactivating NTPase [Falsiruegeria litorea R37]|uniref:GlmZ(SRNA)-inactivating NTPase n=1 Tax=Falsiruegeria litorea R37 TaxID=1200284 RepID=A0A1Y5RT56_9RHOB|nr:RNase adapter RapZ [Falsiruegeria litorea]SLN22175.1 glmZ(sRNA)-inactivating NTPase [Falsiruegeria litorea R37]
MTEIAEKSKQIVLVTGPSGAGRTTAIRVLEDLEFEAIDNLPMGMVTRLVKASTAERPLALGIDTRNRDFTTAGFLDLVEHLREFPDTEATTLYLDCRVKVLLQRFSETRRRHPMAPEDRPEVGIRREMDLLSAVRDVADFLIDTSDLNVHQLRDEVERWFAPEGGRQLAVSVQSFSYKRGLPTGVDMVLDCRFLSNPYWDPALRAMDGRHAGVAEHVNKDERFEPFFKRAMDLIQFLIPAYQAEGKTHLSIAFGCTGGQHRSVLLAETTAKALAEQGMQVSIRHRELERRKGD